MKILIVLLSLFVMGCCGKESSAAREEWMSKNGNPLSEDCNKDLRDAWDNPSLRTDGGPAGGSCCGAPPSYWQELWQDMENNGAPKK